MDIKDRILLQAALNKDTVMFSNHSKIASILRQNDILIEIDEKSKSIHFKYKNSVVTLHMKTLNLTGLNLINNYEFKKLFNFFTPKGSDLLVNGHFRFNDGGVINMVKRFVRMGEPVLKRLIV